MMDDTELKINRFLHEKVMGKCWHEIEEENPNSIVEFNCKHCDWSESIMSASDEELHPDYTSESSPRSLLAEVEAKVIEMKGAPVYWDALYEPFNRDDIRHASLLAATAPASVRAMACAKVCGWEE